MISINVIGLRSRPLRVEGFYTIFLSNNTLEAKPNNGFKESTELTVDAMQYCQAIMIRIYHVSITKTKQFFLR